MLAAPDVSERVRDADVDVGGRLVPGGDVGSRDFGSTVDHSDTAGVASADVVGGVVLACVWERATDGDGDG